MDENDKIKQLAEEFARVNRKRIAQDCTDLSLFAPDDIPVSVFMAGSPGAGKTEYSKNLILLLEEKMKHGVIRIDADDLRRHIPGYTGQNSYLFQTAVSLIVERIHDLALNNKQSFILDGTFSRYDKAIENINRSLNKLRQVRIFYVYQRPEVAWKFTQARERVEGRNIPKEVFIRQFIDSRDVIERIRKEFDDRVIIHLVERDFETHTIKDVVRINHEGPRIEQYVNVRYTIDDLEKLI